MNDIDITALREKAEKALPDGRYGTYTFDGTQRLREFQSIASPQKVLALLDEIERLGNERDEALAVIERAKGRLSTDLYAEDDAHVSDTLTILEAAPADALRERDAEKWDEGVEATWNPDGTRNRYTENPYRTGRA